MARTPMETTQPDTDMTPVQAKNVNELIEAGQQASIAQAAVMESFDVVKAIGRIEAANFFTTVGNKLIAETAIVIRESKKYKGLPYVDENKNSRQVGTFGEFCQVFLGKSHNRVLELISNYNQLGPDLYEQAEKIGFRQRDYNALKALPADDRQLIAQAIEEENLDQALNLMQEMAAKHFREKEQLTKQTTELAQTLEAKDKVIKDKTGVIDTQAERIALLENAKRQADSQPVSVEQRVLDGRTNLQSTALHIKMDVASRLMRHVKELLAVDPNQLEFSAALIIEIKRELDVIVGVCGLPTIIDDNPMPEWMRDDVQEKLSQQYGDGQTPTMTAEMADFLEAGSEA